MIVEKKKVKDRIDFLLEEIFKQTDVDLCPIIKGRVAVTGDPAQDETLLEQVEAALEELESSPAKEFISAVVEAEKLGVKFTFTPAGGYSTFIRCGSEKVVKIKSGFLYPFISNTIDLERVLQQEVKKLQEARRELTERLSAVEKRLDIYLNEYEQENVAK